MNLGLGRKSKESAWTQKASECSRMIGKPRDMARMTFTIKQHHHNTFPSRSPFSFLGQTFLIRNPSLLVQQIISVVVLFTCNLSAFKSLAYRRYLILMK